MFLLYVVWSVFTVYRHKCPKYFRLAFFGTFQLLSSRGLSKLNTFLFRLATTSSGRRDNSTGKGIKSYIGLATRRKKLNSLTTDWPFLQRLVLLLFSIAILLSSKVNLDISNTLSD